MCPRLLVEGGDTERGEEGEGGEAGETVEGRGGDWGGGRVERVGGHLTIKNTY